MIEERLRVSLDQPEREAQARASRVLDGGGAVLYPSDTVYGLLCDATAPEAVAGMARLKGYPRPRPFIVLVDGMETARRLARFSRGALRLAAAFWPGPLTLVLPAGEKTLPHVLSKSGEIALRRPADPLSRGLLSGLGRPLASTSANPAGAAHPLSVTEVDDCITAGCALVLDGGELPPRPPSTVARVSDGEMELLREGAVPLGRLRGTAFGKV
ncbi:MAG: L-threonylcarbamoyladenylate synthase [Candidatus Fermentibacterota bacterium]